MFDSYAAAVAIALGSRDHRDRRDLLMFSALPDAPVLPDRVSRWSRIKAALRRVDRGSPEARLGEHGRARVAMLDSLRGGACQSAAR